jgi:hypothetical protein
LGDLQSQVEMSPSGLDQRHGFVPVDQLGSLFAIFPATGWLIVYSQK